MPPAPEPSIGGIAGNVGAAGPVWASPGISVDASAFTSAKKEVEGLAKSFGSLLKQVDDFTRRPGPALEKQLGRLQHAFRGVTGGAPQIRVGLPTMHGQGQLFGAGGAYPEDTFAKLQATNAAGMGVLNRARNYWKGATFQAGPSPIGTRGDVTPQGLPVARYAADVGAATQQQLGGMQSFHERISSMISGAKTQMAAAVAARGGALRTAGALGTAIGAGDILQNAYATGMTYNQAAFALSDTTLTPGRNVGNFERILANLRARSPGDAANAALTIQQAMGRPFNERGPQVGLQRANQLNILTRGSMGAAGAAQAYAGLFNPATMWSLAQRTGLTYDADRPPSLAAVAQRVMGQAVPGIQRLPREEQLRRFESQAGPVHSYLQGLFPGQPQTQQGVFEYMRAQAQLGHPFTGSEQDKQRLNLNKSANEAQQKWTQSLNKAYDQMSTSILPVMTKFLGLVTGLMKGFSWMNDHIPGFTTAVVGATAALTVLAAVAAGRGIAGVLGRTLGGGAGGAAEGAAESAVPLATRLGLSRVAGATALTFASYQVSGRQGRGVVGKIARTAMPLAAGAGNYPGSTYHPSVQEWERNNPVPKGDTATGYFSSLSGTASLHGYPGEGDGPLPGPGHTAGMKPEIMGKLISLFKANPRLQLNSGFRSSQQQAALYAKYQSGQGPIAAPPGRSMHEKGLAADLGPPSEWNWLQANAPKFGLIRTVTGPGGEMWHYEPAGARSGMGTSSGPVPDTAPSGGGGARLDPFAFDAADIHGKVAMLAGIVSSTGSQKAGGTGGGGGQGGGGPVGPGGKSGAISFAETEGYWIAAGGPPNLAATMAAITGPESSMQPGEIQSGEPYSTTGWGLWQITPGNSVPSAGIDFQLLDPMRNARAAVAKYRSQGLGAWTTYRSGAYRRFLPSSPPAPASVTDPGEFQPIGRAPAGSHVGDAPTPGPGGVRSVLSPTIIHVPGGGRAGRVQHIGPIQHHWHIHTVLNQQDIEYLAQRVSAVQRDAEELEITGSF